MNTKEALAKLSKGERVYQTHSLGQTLSEKSAEYLEQYAASEQKILSQQQAEDVSLPFIQALRKKVSKLVAAPDDNLVVITRFDLHTGIRKLSERSSKDLGLKRLSGQLERTWHEDPMGGLTYGQVKNLVRAFKNDFPRSSAADAIEAECARVGLHKLPVAKLARLAASINTQADFDSVVRNSKLDGDRAEHVRARTLIRSLVAMRTNKSAQDKVADGLLDKSNTPGADDAGLSGSLLSEASDLATQIGSALDQAAMEAFDGGLNDAGQKLQDLSMQLDQWLGGLTDVQDSLQLAGDPVAPPTPKAPPEEGPQHGPEEEPAEELAEPPLMGGNPKKQRPQPPKPLRGPEHDLEDAGLGKKKKLLDPRTWFAAKGVETIRLAKEAAKVADLFEEGEMSESLLKLSEVLNAITGQLAPMLDKKPTGPEPLDMEMPLGEDMPGGMPDMPPPDMADGNVQAPELDTGVQLLQEIEQAADEIIMEAPPEALDYIDHEMGEGHLAPPGTAEWGAEEILNEGHEFAPPTEGWLQEEEQELGLAPGGGLPMPAAPTGPGPQGANMSMVGKAPPGMEDTVMKLKKEYPGNPEAAFATAWSIYNKNKRGGKDECSCGWASGEEVLYSDRCESCQDRSRPKKSQKSKEESTTESRPGGKGIPLPKGKIKSQPEVTTYAKNVPSDGGKALKASEIEDKLLEGKTLKKGDVLIRINMNDEVELWEKGAGRACDIANLDVAIADFMAMTGMRVAQAAPAPAAPASGAPVPNGPTLTPSDIQAALTHYKSMGMGPVDAISALKKDYKERAELETPEMQTQILGISSTLWTSGAPAAPAAPAAAPAELPAPVSMAAAVHAAEGKMKTPSIRKPKDHVSVPKDLGDDSEGKDLLPSPGKINQSQGKPDGKLSDTDLGKDSEGKDLLPDPGKPKANHPPTEQGGTKLPSKKDFPGSDTEGNDPFKTPAISK